MYDKTLHDMLQPENDDYTRAMLVGFYHACRMRETEVRDQLGQRLDGFQKKVENFQIAISNKQKEINALKREREELMGRFDKPLLDDEDAVAVAPLDDEAISIKDVIKEQNPDLYNQMQAANHLNEQVSEIDTRGQ